MHGIRNHRLLRLLSILLLVCVLTLQPVFAAVGDVDGNGQVNGDDYIYLARSLAGWNGYTIPSTAVADFNLDGEVNAKDRLYLARHLAGWQGYELPSGAPLALAAGDYYGRSTLAAEDDAAHKQRCYDYILDGLSNRLDMIDFEYTQLDVQLPSGDAVRVFDLVIADHPELFWASGALSCGYTGDGMISWICPDYYVSAQDLPTMRATFDATVASFLTGIDSSMSEYEREALIHDRIINACTYNSAQNQQWRYTAYGCLVEHTCVCEGYAKAFQVLLAQAGIQALYVSGLGNNENHGWNIVRIDNVYYHVDVTWDDPVVKEGNAPVLLHNYLNVPDSYITEDHTVLTGRMAYNPPVCNSWAANYYTVNGLTAVLELNSIKASIAAQALAGKGISSEFEFFLDTPAAIDDITDFISDNYMAIWNQVNSCCDPSFTGFPSNISYGLNGRVFRFHYVFG